MGLGSCSYGLAPLQVLLVAAAGLKTPGNETGYCRKKSVSRQGGEMES